MIPPIFLDTVGLIALWDQRDKWHDQATAAYEKIRADRSFFVCTSFVLLECGNAAARRPYRASVTDIRRTLEESGGLAVPTKDDWRECWKSYDNGEAGQAGIVDLISFMVMRRLGITRAFTNDQHFRAAGFETLF